MDQDDSNLDMGFRANIEDQYRVDIIDQAQEEESDEDGESDETDDEIYSAHEGVDFRPTGDVSFSFALQPQQPLSSVTSPMGRDPGRQSYPTSDSSDGLHAPGSAHTPSLGSFENQSFEPRQRAQSEINDDELLPVKKDSEEYQFQFPEQVHARRQSPF